MQENINTENTDKEEKDLQKLLTNKYELTFLVYAYISDEIVQEIVTQLEQNNINSFYFEQSESIGRYDILHKGKKAKVTMYNIIFLADNQAIPNIKKTIKSNTNLLKFLIIKYGHNVVPKILDYKYPIEMKKYMFESMRIMPLELTKYTPSQQKKLAINIKRARLLGLIDRTK